MSCSLDPNKAAEYETNVWKAYYAKDLAKAQDQLKLWIEQVYAIKDATQVLPSYLKVIAAFGQMPQDTPKEKYSQSILPLLKDAFAEVKKTSAFSKFDVDSLAKKELDWWVARRLPDDCNPDNVAAIMAEAYALFYGGTSKDYYRSTTLKAYAARYRDQCQDQFGGIDESDWQIINRMLQSSYEILQETLKSKN